MSFQNVINDGSSNPPRLRMQYNGWALIGLPRGQTEWTLPEKLDQLRAAGFDGFEAGGQDLDEARLLAAMLRDRGMGFGWQAYPTKAKDVRPFLDAALTAGADYLTAQVFGSMKRAPQIVDVLEEMYDIVNGAGLPLFIETHRGRVTQDLLRTLRVIDRLPRVRFTGDFSHYVVAGEIGGAWPDDVWTAFKKIARRCGNWHGRIGFGEQVQNDIGDGTGEMAIQFKALWTYGFTAWLKKAQPGDVLGFQPELGPPGYSITSLEGQEMSDRWQQSLVFKRLAEEAWAEAQGVARAG